MRALQVAAAIGLGAWLAGSFAQQGSPPAQPPPPATRPAPPATPRPAPPEAEEDEPAPAGEAADDVFVPTEELLPDAAVTFPVDI